MQMRPAIQLQAVIKALSEVVLPAIDADNKPAIEQAKLSIGLLSLLAEQLPVQFSFDCDELARLIATGRVLVESAAGGAATQTAAAALGDALDRATATLDGARSGPAKVVGTVRRLREATGTLVTEAHADGTAEARAAIDRAVLAMSAEQLLRERALMRMQGWEPDPKAIPPLADLLAG